MPELTDEQKAVVDLKLKSGSRVKVVGFPGVGKTHTFSHYAAARSPTPLLYIAFNKSTVIEAEGKFSDNVRCKTINSIAYQSVGRRYTQDGRRISNGSLSFLAIARKFECSFYEAALVNKTLERWLNSADDELSTEHAEEDSAKKFEECIKDRLVKKAKELWDILVDGNNPYLPMTHGGYLKLFQLTRPVLGYKAILFDEAQDTNPVSMSLILDQSNHGSRVILSGDPYQQIYAWRGAVDALQQVDCETLYLTQSFRFGDQIAEVSNRILGQYFRPEKQILGLSSKQDEVVRACNKAEARTILCRTNSMTFGKMAECVQEDVGFKYIGDLESLMDSIMDVFYLKTNQFGLIKDRKVSCFNRYEDLVDMAQVDQELASKVAIVDKFNLRIPALAPQIRRMSTVPSDITITTAHKSKGLEFEVVELAEDFPSLIGEDGRLLMLRTPTTPEKSKKHIDQGEINLLYVAASRAKRKLVLNQSLSDFLDYREDEAEFEEDDEDPY